MMSLPVVDYISGAQSHGDLAGRRMPAPRRRWFVYRLVFPRGAAVIWLSSDPAPRHIMRTETLGRPPTITSVR